MGKRGLAEELTALVKGDVENTAEVLETYSRDASLFVVRPEVVVYPKDVEDIQTIVRYVRREREAGSSVNLTARAAGTDMSGGPLGNSIILDVTRYLNKFIELTPGCAVVEPGMYFRDFDKKTKAEGYLLPSYTASREICTVGGMVANNSGGEKNLKYGKTANYVEEVDMVLADGNLRTFASLDAHELAQKCDQSDFEGQIYRELRELLERHEGVIERARPKVTKNSAGYALWGVKQSGGKFNIAQLIVGSQGTLGIITKIKFRLVEPKPHSAMAIIFLPTLKHLGTLVTSVLAHDPESFESYDDHTFALAVKYFPEFATQMKSNMVKLGFSFLPEVWMAMTGGVPKLILLVEFAGNNAYEAETKARKLAYEIRHKYHLSVKIARNEREARKYWVVRRESFNLLRKKVRGLRTAPFIDDFVVPPGKLPEFFPKLEHLLSHYKITYTIAGHVGDGNFHIIPLVDPKDPCTAPMIDALSHTVYDLVIAFGGSISGEHNDGLIRTPYIGKMFGFEMVKLFERVKSIFDPLGMFNPGKKVGTNFEQAYKHLDLAGVRR